MIVTYVLVIHFLRGGCLLVLLVVFTVESPVVIVTVAEHLEYLVPGAAMSEYEYNEYEREYSRRVYA